MLVLRRVCKTNDKAVEGTVKTGNKCNKTLRKFISELKYPVDGYIWKGDLAVATCRTSSFATLASQLCLCLWRRSSGSQSDLQRQDGPSGHQQKSDCCAVWPLSWSYWLANLSNRLGLNSESLQTQSQSVENLSLHRNLCPDFELWLHPDSVCLSSKLLVLRLPKLALGGGEPSSVLKVERNWCLWRSDDLSA